MTIKSMTGFGQVELELDQFYISAEVKTVNHRFIDFKFRMPSFLSSKELEYRKILKKHLTRGSVETSIQVRKINTENSNKEIDYKKVNKFLADFKENVKESLNLNPMDFFKSDFLLEQSKNEAELIEKSVLSVLSEAVVKNLDSRKEEGLKLKDVLISNLNSYDESLNLVEKCSRNHKTKVKEKIKNRFKENNIEIDSDDGRFQKEIIFLLEKMDIDEEIQRARIHIQKLLKILSGTKVAGREIEFTLQELNRETNTIGSKSSDLEVSDQVVEMKVFLEKMREQALNIE